MRENLSTFATGALAAGLLGALGVWTYIGATHRGAQNDFPLADDGMAILLIIFWWWTGPETFHRKAPFDAGGITQAPAKAEVGHRTVGETSMKKRLLWTTASLMAWFLLQSKAGAAARIAALEPSTQSVMRYGINSLEFIAFLYLWIIVFPIFRSPREQDVIQWARLPLLRAGIPVVAGLTGVWFAVRWGQHVLRDPLLSASEQFRLVQTVLARTDVFLYVLLVSRRFMPVALSRPREQNRHS